MNISFETVGPPLPARAVLGAVLQIHQGQPAVLDVLLRVAHQGAEALVRRR